MNSAPPTRCTACGVAVDTALLGGVCPACLLGQVVQAGEESEGENYGGHRLLDEIARGGMGVVYRALQLEPERIVALKTLRSAVLDSPEAMARFKHEVEVMVALDHPAILPVHQWGEANGIPYFTMKLAEGGTLANRLDRYQGRWRDIAELMVRIGEGVGHAHGRGVLHRDLKPGNILFDTADGVFVSDFGIAKLADADNAGLTMTVAMIGTPHYLAPEVAAGGSRAASVASDVWSLGVILYELLTGQKPFPGESLPQVLHALEIGDVVAPGKLKPDVPRDLSLITLKALAREPAHRYESAPSLVADLRAWLEGRPITARTVPATERVWMWARRKPWLAGMGALLILAVMTTVGSLAWGYVRVKREVARVAASEAKARAQLRESRFQQARAGRLAHEMGWRSSGLNALREAYAARPGDDVRDEAIAHLAGFDFELTERRFEDVRYASPDLELHLRKTSRNELIVCQASDGAERLRLPPLSHPGSLRVVFDPRGRWLAVSTEDGMSVYSLKDRKELGHWPGTVLFQEASTDGEYLPAEEKDRWVLRRTSDWSVAGVIARKGDGFAVSAVRSHPDSRNQPLVAARLHDDSLVIMSWQGGTVLDRKIPMGQPLQFGWVGDVLLARLGEFGQMFDFRRNRFKLLMDFDFADQFFRGPGPDFGLTTGRNAATQFWHLPSGTKLAKAHGIVVQQCRARDLRFITVGPPSNEGMVIQPTCVRFVPDRVLTSMAPTGPTLSPDGRLLALADGVRVAVYEVETGRLLAVEETARPWGALFSPDGRELWMATERGMQVFELTRRNARLSLVPAEETAFPDSTRTNEMIPLPDGRGVLVRFRSAGVLAWRRDTTGWKPWDGPPGMGFATPSLSPDGRWVVGIPNGASEIQEMEAPYPRRLLGSSSTKGRATFSPDSKRLVFVDATYRWEVFDAPDWRPVVSFDGPSGASSDYQPALQGVWSADGSWFAAASSGHEVRLIETGTWRTMARLHGPIDVRIGHVALIQGGTRLLVQRENVVEIWDLARLKTELKELGMDLQLPPATQPPPPPPELAGPFEEVELPPLFGSATKPAK